MTGGGAGEGAGLSWSRLNEGRRAVRARWSTIWKLPVIARSMRHAAAEILPPERVLDIGASDGRFGRRLAEGPIRLSNPPSPPETGPWVNRQGCLWCERNPLPNSLAGTDLQQQLGHAELATTQIYASALSARRRAAVMALDFGLCCTS